MLAEILTIGDELCRGEIVDTNSSWLAAELWAAGVTVGWMSSCRDVAEDMRAAFRDAAARADLVLVSGGLGPTEDDLTVDVLAGLLGCEPVTDEPSLERMRARFARANFPITPNNLRQVRVPARSRAFVNPAGLAPGFEVALPAAAPRPPVPCFVFPGVPRELKALYEQAVLPRILELSAGAPRIARRIYRVFGAGESHVDHRLSGIATGVPGASVHFQVAFPETLVKLVVKDADAGAAAARLAGLDAELRARLGDLAYAEGADDSLAAALGRRLAAAGLTVAVAESCTGGMLGSLITDVPGSSAWFRGGWIVYANELKQALGVPAELLAAHGAVSQPVVESLARAARERAGATIGVAISGVAGPDGGTAEKPVGTVHVAVSGPGPDAIAHKRYVFPGARDQVRRLAAYWAMKLVHDGLPRPGATGI